MMFYSQNKKKKLYGVVLLILCAFILVFTAPTAKASNVYTSNISFYKGADGIVRVKFYVNTSFDIVVSPVTYVDGDREYCATAGTYSFGKINNDNSFSIIAPDNSDLVFATCDRTFHYVAGQTYDNIVLYGQAAVQRSVATKKICVLDNCNTNFDVDSLFRPLTSADYFRHAYYVGSAWPTYSDTEDYYFTEYPNLTIDYPLPDAEISGAFYITGSYTIPAESGFDTLLAMVNEPGIYGATYYGFFQMDLAPPGDDVNIRVAGVPAGEYEIFFAFMEYADDSNIYISPVSIPITILVGSPSEFEPGETPPPIFNILDPDSYYTANSNYASSTLVFDNLSGAVKPLVLKIGDYLTFFSSKFDDEIAKETGEEMASGVLIVRAYADNLNTFFGDLPISQALFFYLLLLVVVAVFRIVRNLINLIKP